MSDAASTEVSGSGAHEVRGPTSESIRDSRSWKTWLFGIYLVLFWWGATSTVIGYWPRYHDVERLQADTTRVRVEKVISDSVRVWRPAIFWKVPPFAIQTEPRYLILATAAGVLGGFVHCATSFAAYVGGQQLLWSWGWWYVLRPFIGGALALGVYFLLRAGLIVGSGDVGTLNASGVTAIAFLTGMFSKEAVQKLEDVARHVLSLKEDKLPDKLGNKGKKDDGAAP